MRSLALLALVFSALVLPSEAFAAKPSSAEMVAYCKRMLASDAELSFLVRVRRASMPATWFVDQGTSRLDPMVELVALDGDGGDWLVFCQFDRHYPLTAKLFARTPDFCDCDIK